MDEEDKLSKLTLALMASRNQAIDGRLASGIEDIWRQDEEYYEGIDEANRTISAWQGKPLGQAGISEDSNETSGSTIFVNITATYCDTAAARLGDMILYEKAWELEPTPVVELIPIAGGKIPRDIQNQITDAQTDPETGAVDKDGVARTENDVIKLAKKEVAEAQKKVGLATKRIEDWHAECKIVAEIEKVLEDCARVGSGVLKGPIPAKSRKMAYVGGKFVVKEEIKPVSKHINYWNAYPDPACGQDLHAGSYFWERDDIGFKGLVDLIKVPGYNKEKILKVIKQGPQTALKIADATLPEQDDLMGLTPRDKKHLFEIWYMYGRLSRDEIFGEDEDFKFPDDRPYLDIQATMVNNETIRLINNPLDTGEIPYDILPWKRRYGSPWGLGVSTQVRTAQNIVNGGVRSMMDNAGRAAGPQVVMQHGVVTPEDDVYEIAPWKVWIAAEDADQAGLDNAFRFVKVDMLQQELQSIVELGLKLAEDITGIAMILQGQTNHATPKTLGGMQLQNSNASTILRRGARIYDHTLIEPHLGRYYNYLLQYGDDKEKGEFNICSKGAAALVEKDAEGQELLQMGDLVTNPIFRLDPIKWIREYLKGRKVDISKLEYTDSDWEDLVAKLATPPKPVDNQIETAKIRAQADIKVAEINAKNREEDRASREGIEASKLASQREFEGVRADTKMGIQKIIASINKLKVAKDHQKSADKIKADMAQLVLTLNVQKELSGTSSVAKPAVEPPGRAPDGEAFAK